MIDKPWAMILAGGDGTRLQGVTQAISGRPIPKQYCALFGSRSLFEETIERALHFTDPERILVVLNRTHLADARDQLGEIPAANVLVQPRNVDTGPGVLFGLLHLARRDSRARVAIFPSDHFIGNDTAFLAHVRGADDFVARQPQRIAMLGVPATAADMAYGYIVRGAPLTTSGRERIYEVASFCEKPTPGAAAALLARGALKNTFILAGQLDEFLRLLAQVRPRDTEALSILRREPLLACRLYRQLEPWSFSRDFLGRIRPSLAVVEVDDVEWSDWETPASIARTLEARPPHAASLSLERALRSAEGQ